MSFKCPYCSTVATYRHNLITHLKGARHRGGHELDEVEAARVADSAGAGTSPRAAPSAPAVIRRAPRQNPLELPAIAPLTDEVAAAAYLQTLLETLVAFKRLPKYQFERRVDIFLVPFLPEILAKCLSVAGPIELVVPEFPLKLADSNQSTNADYLLFDRTPGQERWVLFELKTDDRSIKADQLATYRRAIAKGMKHLVRDVDTISHATAQGRKYDALVDRLRGYPAERPIVLVYLSPASLATDLSSKGEHSITFGDLLALELSKGFEVWNLLRSTVIAAGAGAR